MQLKNKLPKRFSTPRHSPAGLPERGATVQQPASGGPLAVEVASVPRVPPTAAPSECRAAEPEQGASEGPETGDTAGGSSSTQDPLIVRNSSLVASSAGPVIASRSQG
jgi:hypothetical protein